MKVEQSKWTLADGWSGNSQKNKNAQLVFVFGAASNLKKNDLIQSIKIDYPNAKIIGCSTAGEIIDTNVLDDSLIVTAVQFNETIIKGGKLKLADVQNSFQAGERLAKLLEPYDDLIHVFVLSDGISVNGSDLVKGLVNNLPESVSITGGLAGDGINFKQTFVIWDDSVEADSLAIVGFYGNKLKVGFGSLGGWDPFGPERLVTKSTGNILYELDGRSALTLYKQYLGEHASGLPATGLLFPLSIRNDTEKKGVVRTILGINEDEQSLTFAGDIPQGAFAQLMKANFDRLIDGAVGAAKDSKESSQALSSDLAVLISCVGRKLVLKQRIEEEVEGAKDVLGNDTKITGFYSYGEISPFKKFNKCELHNQTMTITTFSED